MSTSKEIRFHRFCTIFPPASEAALKDLADSIKTHGLQEDIITLDGEILDGRNRYLACKIAGVEPVFEEYGEDMNPIEYVFYKNFQRRHLTDGQRAMVAQDAYARMKEEGIADATMERIAKRFNTSERTMRDAGIVRKNASENVQKAVQDGSIRLNRAVEAVKAARKETGITVEPDTPLEEKKKVHEAQERIISEKSSLSPTKPPKSPGQAFADRVTSGEFNGKRWRRNIAEMQAKIAALESMPALYHDNFELLKSLADTALLNTHCSMWIDTVKKVKERLQRNEKPDFSEVKKIFTDLTANRFPSIENDFGKADRQELCESLKNKLIADCDKCVKEVESVRKKLMLNHHSGGGETP